MAPTSIHGRPASGTDLVRARLLTSLHIGRLGPGDRVPSVRRLADLTGLNRKTVHRAFQRLANEGLLEARPGSGTFIRGRTRGARRSTSRDDLVAAVDRIRAVAVSLDLKPAVFSAFVSAALGDALVGLPVAVVECNHEQLRLISEDLTVALGLNASRVPLSSLRRDREVSLRGKLAVITSDCHLDEVAELVGPAELPIRTVSLDPAFPRSVLELARRNDVLMVVRDRRFGPIFDRLLHQLGAPDAVIARVRTVHVSEASEAFRSAAERTFVSLSPEVPDTVRDLVPRRLRLVRDRWRVPQREIARVRAGLSLDYACARGDARPSAS